MIWRRCRLMNAHRLEWQLVGGPTPKADSVWWWRWSMKHVSELVKCVRYKSTSFIHFSLASREIDPSCSVSTPNSHSRLQLSMSFRRGFSKAISPRFSLVLDPPKSQLRSALLSYVIFLQQSYEYLYTHNSIEWIFFIMLSQKNWRNLFLLLSPTGQFL